MSTEVRKAEFHFDSHPDTTFPGYTKGDTWNGWACPYFEREVAKEIADHYGEMHRYDNEEEYWAEYDSEEDIFLFYDTQGDEPRKFGPAEVEGRKLYPIGAYCWTWVEK